MQIVTKRRQFLFALSSFGALLGCQNVFARGELEAVMGEILGFDDLTLPSDEAIDFDVFYRFCQLVTAQVDLDLDVARSIYDLNQEEPWGIFHASSIYRKIVSNKPVIGPAPTLPNMIENDEFSEGEEWYLTHLMTTWLMGIYYHESKTEPVRVSFNAPLMRQVVADFIPVPGASEFAPGYWAHNPAKQNLDQ